MILYTVELFEVLPTTLLAQDVFKAYEVMSNSMMASFGLLEKPIARCMNIEIGKYGYYLKPKSGERSYNFMKVYT